MTNSLCLKMSTLLSVINPLWTTTVLLLSKYKTSKDRHLFAIVLKVHVLYWNPSLNYEAELFSHIFALFMTKKCRKEPLEVKYIFPLPQRIYIMIILYIDNELIYDTRSLMLGKEFVILGIFQVDRGKGCLHVPHHISARLPTLSDSVWLLGSGQALE